jgi:hypothetical protein
MLSAPAAPVAFPAAARTDGSATNPGFAQAMLLAGFADPAPALPSAFFKGTQFPTGLQRNAKNMRQQPKGEDQTTVVAPTTTPQPAPPVLPLWLQLFSGSNGGHEQPAHNPAPEGRSAEVDSVTETPKPPAPDSPQLTTYSQRRQPASQHHRQLLRRHRQLPWRNRQPP